MKWKIRFFHVYVWFRAVVCVEAIKNKHIDDGVTFCSLLYIFQIYDFLSFYLGMSKRHWIFHLTPNNIHKNCIMLKYVCLSMWFSLQRSTNQSFD